MAGSSSSTASPPSTLICNEDDVENVDDCIKEEDDDYICLLLSRESCYGGGRARVVLENSCSSARSDVLRWILETKDVFGFGFRTIYTAMTYFDRLFMHKTVDIMVKEKTWAVKLLSVACLSLAAKMEEREAPALSELGRRDYRFSIEATQRMELFALSTMKWRMLTVTPFPYLNVFASKFFYIHGSSALISKAIKLIFAIIEVMNLVDFRPSAVAAAAILAALDERLTKKSVESKIRLISLCGSLDSEHVFSCYSLMNQEAHKEKGKAAKNLASSYSLPASN